MATYENLLDSLGVREVVSSNLAVQTKNAGLLQMLREPRFYFSLDLLNRKYRHMPITLFIVRAAFVNANTQLSVITL